MGTVTDSSRATSLRTPLGPLGSEQREDVQRLPNAGRRLDARWRASARVVGHVASTLASATTSTVVERIEDQVDLLLTRDQRRGDEQRRLLAAGGDQGPRSERPGGHAAGQWLGLLSVPRLPGRAVKLDRPVEATAVDPAHTGMRLREAPHPFQHEPIEVKSAAIDLVARRDSQVGADCGNGGRMAPERRVGLPTPGADQLGQLPGQHDRPGGGGAGRQALAHRHHVGPSLPVSELEPAADPAEAGDGLIGDPQSTGGARSGGHAVLVPRRVVDAALAVVQQDSGAAGQRLLRRRDPVVSLRRIGLTGDARPRRGRE